MISLSAIPIHFPALSRLSASAIFSLQCLVILPIKIPAGIVKKIMPVAIFQKARFEFISSHFCVTSAQLKKMIKPATYHNNEVK